MKSVLAALLFSIVSMSVVAQQQEVPLPESEDVKIINRAKESMANKAGRKRVESELKAMNDAQARLLATADLKVLRALNMSEHHMKAIVALRKELADAKSQCAKP